MKITLPNLLTIIFVTLKLCGTIQWSWWWILAPTWMLALFWIGVLVVIGLVAISKE